MTTVLLEGANLGDLAYPWSGRKGWKPARVPPEVLRQFAAELRATGQPSRATLDRMAKAWPVFVDVWRNFKVAGVPQLQGLDPARRGRHPQRHAWAARLGEVENTAPATSGALARILASVPDPAAAQAYYTGQDPIHAADNLQREQAWAAMIADLSALVRAWVKPDATRAQVEELALRIGLNSDASGQSIVPDRKMAELPGANHASWMGGAIGYGGIGSWQNLRNQAQTYLNQGFQWAEIFGRWSDPPNARTLANDSGAYPYLPEWAQALAAQAWKNRRMIAVENAGQAGHLAHADQRARSWDAQMEPLKPNETAVGSPQVANAIIAAGVAAAPVVLAVPDPTYMAPWEKAPTKSPAPSAVLEAPVPIMASGGKPMFRDADVPTLSLTYANDAGAAIPYMQAVVDHAPPPVATVEPAPPQVVPKAVDPKTALPPTNAAGPASGTVPTSTAAPMPVMSQQAAQQAAAQAAVEHAAAQQYLAQQQAMAAAQQQAGGSWFDQQMIPGVKNLYLVIGAGGLLLLLLSRRRG